MPGNSEVDRTFSGSRGAREVDELTEVLLESALTEECKWRKPCYVFDGRSICLIQPMKDFLALLFFRGALLKHPDGVLEQHWPNSHYGFRMRVTSVEDVARLALSIKTYVREAIEVEKAGLKVEPAPDLEYPEELVTNSRKTRPSGSRSRD